MTLRQKILKWIYPLLIRFKKIRGENKNLEQPKVLIPKLPLHDLSVLLNNGAELPLASLKGRKLLIVNTASNCGYTGQYAELQELYERYKDRLVVLGFPSNDFKKQEKGTDEEIARFCQVNYGVSFPLAKKSVVRGAGQNPVFQWLTHKERNGWNEQQPSWNFAKYLVNEEGALTHYFDPAVSPLSLQVIRAIDPSPEEKKEG
jgi:glutathione peroxidase